MAVSPSRLPRRPARLPILLALACLALTACGGGSASSSKTSTTLAGAGPGGGSTVSIRNDGGSWSYGPKTLTVAAGTQVTWANDSNAPHTVTFDDKSLPSSELFNEHQTYQATLTKPGRFPYICAIHPAMKATVVVT